MREMQRIEEETPFKIDWVNSFSINSWRTIPKAEKNLVIALLASLVCCLISKNLSVLAFMAGVGKYLVVDKVRQDAAVAAYLKHVQDNFDSYGANGAIRLPEVAVMGGRETIDNAVAMRLYTPK